MCGICGITWARSETPPSPRLIEAMNRTLQHRGPDDEGYYHGSQAHIGMRRLSIIDLETGDQPLCNEDGTLWLVFNGELYNYRQLRHQLQQTGHQFRSNSDSEVVLHAYEAWGVDCLQRFNGMFAFALWDDRERRLWLARDRLGIKPLYYWSDGRSLVFGSELKAVIANPSVPAELDVVALDQLLTLEYIPAPRTLFEGICKLPAGHWLSFAQGRLRLQSYWEPAPGPIPAGANEQVERLRELIASAVQMQMVSDVPLGALLSGGIDSSTVVAFMNRQGTAPVPTFSIGFKEATYNELPYARMVAQQFGAEHHVEVIQSHAVDLAEQLVRHMDEPLADFSIFPTYLVSQLARRSVKVALSGDGGDELFGGYDTYVAQQMSRYYRWLPESLRHSYLPALLARARPRPAKKGLVNKAKRFVEGGALPGHLQHTRWMIFLGEEEGKRLYQPQLYRALNGNGATLVLERYFQQVSHLDALSQQQYVDIKTYLADDILTKVDRMSMAVSLEVRVPLLDHRIVEFALALPASQKLRHGQTKLILRRAMQGILPQAVLQKPKEGFSIPLKHWLRGPLRPMMTDLLSADSVRRRNYFVPRTVAQWMAEHLDGRANHSHRLWALMVLELWHRQVLDRRAAQATAEPAIER
jgi:asparagine synthase (glutamine-hydrolysing)